MRFFIEWHGCSMSKNETEMIKGVLEKNSFSEISNPEKADLIILNACGVKDATENRMIKRIRELNELRKKNSRFIVFGCLSSISPERIKKISDEIELCGVNLNDLCRLLEISLCSFSPIVSVKRFNEFISIISIAEGCLGKCSYCATVNARGKLKSHPINEIKKSFENALKDTKEIWLTAQDTGAYGFDSGKNLADLLKELLKAEGNYRIRIGMMNPLHLKKFIKDYVKLFMDERLFRFVHLPVQSGSDKILKAMKRGYSRKQFIDLCRILRKEIPGVTIFTDIIAGFPGETEKDFQDSVDLLELVKPDVINISRFGARPNTEAALMPNQLPGSVKKKRSRILTDLCIKFSFNANKKLVGSKQLVLVSEKGRKHGFMGRTSNYRSFAVKNDLRGKFIESRVKKAFSSYLTGEIEKVF
ncbi:MAG: tRNA (N(6)-L-threonylcarbamoyladenosine(37)-C(2))-methylthiotransferase [Candidatus Diapherotrites archaeon]